MTLFSNAVIQIGFYSLVVTLLSVPLGLYMAHVFAGERTFLDPVLAPIERFIYRICGIRPANEQTWVEYTVAVLLFSVVGMVVLYALERLQYFLPLNPQGFAGVEPGLAFNTAASFTTNTNWQAYSGESTMSYLTQMAGLTFHNYVSAAAGLAIAVAVIRGFARHSGRTLGNFWYDLVRGTLWVLLPICLIFATILIWQGVPQNFSPYTQAKTVEGAAQSIAQGPVASQIAIKQLGTNGGGFFNANSAHPFENPTPLTNFLEMAALIILGAALPHTFGKMVGDRRQGWALYATMGLLFAGGVIVCTWAEQRGNPQFASIGIDQAASAQQSGGNMEGKEVRFGIVNSALWATATTDASNGSVNAMHDSFTPIGGLIPLFNLHLGEVVFGGVGTGLAGMIVMAILTVFIAGLMVGRTPEYLGKKIQAHEMKLAMLYILVFAAIILIPTAVAVVNKGALSSLNNQGPHGFSEILYAFSSGAANNGSAFGGLNANTMFYNILIGVVMLLGRFGTMIPVMAIAGSVVEKKTVPVSAGTFPTNGYLFVILLGAVVLIVGALTFFASWALGPIVEHLAMMSGKLY